MTVLYPQWILKSSFPKLERAQDWIFCLWAECLASQGALWHCPMSVRLQVWSPRVRFYRAPVTWLLLKHSNPVIHLTSNLPQSSLTSASKWKYLHLLPQAYSCCCYFAPTPLFFLRPLLPTASDFSGWLLPVGPLFKIPPIKTNSLLNPPQCHTVSEQFAPIPALSPHRKQLFPWLTPCWQAEHQEGWEGSICPASLGILHGYGWSIAGWSSTSQGMMGLPTQHFLSRESHVQGKFKDNANNHRRYQHYSSGTFHVKAFFNLPGAWWRWVQGSQTHRNIYSGSAK